MSYAEIKKEFDECEKKLGLGDFQDVIEYQHLDGTVCRFHCATYKEFSDGWFAIFSEHNGNILNNKADVKWIKKIKEEYIFFNEEEDL